MLTLFRNNSYLPPLGVALLLNYGLMTSSHAAITDTPPHADNAVEESASSTQPSNDGEANQAEASDAEKEDEENVLSARLDPKHQQYMRGQLAYWFEMYQAAYELWKPLADEGEPKSQTNIGWLYHQGLYVEKNLVTAFEWYQKAAEQSYIIAQHNLGTMYEHGWGTEQNYEEAAKWYQFGVEKAYGPSLYNLGMLHLNGLGVKMDRNIALHHLRSAHQLKVSEATSKLIELGIEVEIEAPEVRQPPQPMRHNSMRGEQQP